MPTQQQIISWKSSAWMEAGVVAAYALRLSDPSGPQGLMAILEESLLRRNTVGKSVLDVGIGTGRAGIALAQAGYAVTGADNSRAMLNKCRELAGAVPLNLVQSDLADLPFSAATFDTVVSLNTLLHFPNWHEVLSEWQRVTVPGGRILFDCGSGDHQAQPDASVVGYTLRIAVEELCNFATRCGMTVVAITPYGLLAGSAAPNRFFAGSSMHGFAWDRILSWAATDALLLAFFVFLEQELFAKFSSGASSRMFVILQNADGGEANARFAAQNTSIARTLSEGLSARTLSKLGVNVESFISGLNLHLAHEPNRFALYRILSANLGWNWPIAVPDFVAEVWLGEASSVLRGATIDRDFSDFLSGFHGSGPLREAFAYRGVDLGCALEVDLMIQLLDGPARAFDA